MGFKPSPVLQKRFRFTTKQVGKGFYRGTGTGSMGAHTEYGGYIIDYRKARHYNMPDLANFKLSPFVSKEINPREHTTNPDGTPMGKKMDGMDFLKMWKQNNPAEYDQIRVHQEQSEGSDDKK